jgi:hypothetical protein
VLSASELLAYFPVMQAKGKKNARREEMRIWLFDAASVYMRQDNGHK